ncbi:NAD(P)-binding protein [Durotheca rogersii]|uniref:NAD(P)-binding protein n=1 Tax=Durotheca rogersii TaxID=419775 RepID=UPI00221FBD3C|nr:NAD(P)-binding protein [Durotheca rogersii]KAI5857331.1 NAD(P)-binding protein [Durotheca rogersii]
MFEKTLARHGHIDIVVGNAGIDEVVEDAFVDRLDYNGCVQPSTLIVLDVTLRGVIYTTKLALSFFRPKHGVLGLVRSLRDSLKTEGLVRANVVAPAFTQTRFTQHLLETWRANDWPINQPEDVARAISFLALNPDYHGKTLYIAAGTYTELEDPIQASRETWLGKQNTAWVDSRKAKGVRLGKQDRDTTVG